jgi:beta-carotene 15,15'-dioxygenase
VRSAIQCRPHGYFRIQGLVFSAVAICVSVASLFIARFDQQVEFIVLAVLIIALGVPHGALDTIFARQLYGVHTAKGWLGFVILYLILATLVVGLWLLTPFLFLSGFLVISITHFSGDPSEGTPILSRALYGGAIIILPVLLHSEEVTRIFSFLVNIDAAERMVWWLHVLAFPWTTALVFAAAYHARGQWLTSLEFVCLGLLAALAPPLVAFTVFFCVMHSARHIMRTFDYSGKSSAYLMVAAALGPMSAIMLVSIGAWFIFRDTPLDARIIQIVFIGLAALTVPHMALVEQVRMSGWVKGAHRN